MSEHQHEDYDQESSFGLALGFRIFEDEGELYLAEAEISPYVDEPDSLGATLVFHPLREIDPALPEPDVEWPAYPLEIDDTLTRDESAPTREQFTAIARQLATLSEADLRDYLRRAREEAEA